MITVTNFFGSKARSTLPITRKIVKALVEGSSIILSGPRYFYTENLAFEAINKAYEDLPNRRVIRLSAVRKQPNGGLDFDAVWSETKKQLSNTSKVKSRVKCTQSTDYVNLVMRHFQQSPQPLTIFLLRSGDRTYASQYRDLLDAIHQIVDRSEIGDSGSRSIFVAIDDFSLHYFIQDSEVRRSEWFRAQWLQFGHLTENELRDWCSHIFEELMAKPDLLDCISSRLFQFTDGHIGLIVEFLEHVSELDKTPIKLLTEDNEKILKSYFDRLSIVERIRFAISDDSLGLCETAVDHRDSMMPNDYRSPRIQILRQLGILRWDNSYEARLCHGTIGTMVEAVANQTANQKRKSRLGTVKEMGGIARYEDRDFTPSDSDIVVMHISDLHFGQDFAYRLTIAGRTYNESQIDLKTLIERDVIYQNLKERIDALVISGDIVCTGASEEYNRAIEVLQDIINVLHIAQSHVIVVPGNHDLQWNPGDFAKREGMRNVSRENYDNFYFSLCGRKSNPADLVKITSRDGKYGLKIISLDSNEVEGQDAAGIGFVGEDCLREANRLLLPDSEPNSSIGMRTWFVMHHHLSAVTSVSLTNAKRRNVSVLANAPMLLAHIREFGVEAVLHGHEHQPAVTELKWWLGERNSEFGAVTAICAGSISAKRERLGPVSRNQYMLLVRRPAELIVRSRVIGDEGFGFQAHEDLSIVPSKSASE